MRVDKLRKNSETDIVAVISGRVAEFGRWHAGDRCRVGFNRRMFPGVVAEVRGFVHERSDGETFKILRLWVEFNELPAEDFVSLCVAVGHSVTLFEVVK